MRPPTAKAGPPWIAALPRAATFSMTGRRSEGRNRAEPRGGGLRRNPDGRDCDPGAIAEHSRRRPLPAWFT